jgi:hypothetical protein
MRLMMTECPDSAIATGVELRILQRSNSRWIVSLTSWESMMAPSTIASADSGSQPRRETCRPRPRPRSLSWTTLTELSPMSSPTRFLLRPKSMVPSR